MKEVKTSEYGIILAIVGLVAVVSIILMGMQQPIQLSDETLVGDARFAQQTATEQPASGNDLVDMCINSAFLQSLFHCNRIGEGASCIERVFYQVLYSCMEMIEPVN